MNNVIDLLPLGAVLCVPTYKIHLGWSREVMVAMAAYTKGH